MTKLCVPIFVHDADQALSDARCAKAAGGDLVELRLDTFAEDADAAVALVRGCPLPCIVTCRPTCEGGMFDGEDADRIALLEYIGTACEALGPAYFDVELATYDRSANLRQKVNLVIDHLGQARPTDTGLILSSHDFEGRPSDLLRRISAMAGYDACRVIKIVWYARSLRDNLEAFELIADRHKPTIALCMGEYGLASRVLAKKFGAMLTFASLGDESSTAPGQPTIQNLKSLYRWDHIGSKTQVFGVIGDPVGHSMSPAIHNAGFDATGFDGVYLPMPIPPEYEHFKATVGSWLDDPRLDFRGASVTLPHKQNLLRFVEERGGEIEPLAAKIGAANTLHKRDDGSLYASNTDYAAALDAVRDGLTAGQASSLSGSDKHRQQLAGKRITILGAGGVARAIVAGFTHCGAHVTIHNRTPENAKALAENFGAAHAPLDAVDLNKTDILINCTPLGMSPNASDSPINFPDPPSTIAHPPLVFDTIYNPRETKLLRDARAAGCATVSGIEMFVRQAAAQFERWTGCDAPMEVFRDVVLTGLQDVQD